MVISFKEYLEESTKVHPELAAHGIDAEAVKKYLHMRKTELDGSGLESRGEKMKHSRAKNAFFNHLDKIHNGDEKKVRLAYHKLSTMHDDKGEKSLYEAIKGWKHAHSDLAKIRSSSRDASKTVHLVSLKKDGTESKMHDATKHFDSEEAARAHHANVKKLNPSRSIKHNLYVGGEHKDTLE